MGQRGTVTRKAPRGTSIAIGVIVLAVAGCEQGLSGIDRNIDAVMARTSRALGEGASAPSHGAWTDPASGASLHDPEPTTVNPAASSMQFTPSPEEETTRVIERLEAYNRIEGQARSLDLAGALAHAVSQGREFRTAEETYLLTTLSLLTEEHRWGPRLANDLSTTFDLDGDRSFFESSLDVVNDLSVSRKLPGGASVSAHVLATIAEDLNTRVSAADANSANLILSAEIPLLRGAGLVANEDILQARRNVVYAARTFERFRRTYMVDIAGDFLELIVLHRQIENAEQSIEYFQWLADRQRALHEAGRARLFDAANAENQALAAIGDLTGSRESFRLSLDRFKTRIGYDLDDPVVIAGDSLGLPIPAMDMGDALGSAMRNRLDLQSQRDALDDTARAVLNARNALLPDLDLIASADIPGSGTGLRIAEFDHRDVDLDVALTLSLPLDRTIERLALRQSQITLDQARRDYDKARDTVAIEVRSAVRSIDSGVFNLDVQERNVQISELGKAAIDADPDRASVLDQIRAIDDLRAARDGRDEARRDLDLAVLDYLLQTGQLRITVDGTIEPIPGMAELGDDPGSPPQDPEEKLES